MASSASPDIRTPLKRPNLFVGIAVLAIAAFAAYYPALRGEFIIDDDSLLTDNALVKSPDGLYRIWCTTEPVDYWPLANTTLWIEWRLWGLNPTGYHVTNLALHVAATLLIWAVLRTLAIPGGFLAALLFAVHPVNVESVAWISQRKGALAIVFFLLSILWFLREEDARAGSEKQTHGEGNQADRGLNDVHGWYWLSLLAFLLAMLSKGSVATLPILLLLIVWWRRRRVGAGDVARAAPFFLVAIVLTAVNLWFQTHGMDIVVRDVTFSQRIVGAGAVVWFYLSKALAPIELIFSYSQWQIDSHALLWWLPLAAALTVTLFLCWRSISSRTNWGRAILFAWLFFCVALLPVLGFADVGFMQYTLVADHYQHVGIIAVTALAAAAWSTWRTRSQGASRWLATVSAIAAVGILTFLCWRQSSLYRGPITLYEATIQENPSSWYVRNNLGIILRKQGRTEDAKRQFDEALRLKPDSPLTHYNLGNLFKDENSQSAIEEYQRALQLQPVFYDAHNNLGIALLNSGRPKEAALQFSEAVKDRPYAAIARSNLGFALALTGQLPEAIEQLEEVLRLKPDLAPAHRNLGFALAKAGRPEEAIAQYRQAIELDPNQCDDHYKLGNLLLGAGKFSEAIEQLHRALELNPDYAEAESKLAVALLNTEHPQEALEHCKKALQLRPNDTEACANMALAYDQMHQPSQAIATGEKALDMARSQGQTEEAKQIEAWLKSYRAQMAKPPNATPRTSRGAS